MHSQRSSVAAASLLFVYGTLRAGLDTAMSRRLRQLAEHLGPARARGRLYDLGPYPAMLEPRRTADWVVGDLYRLSGPCRTLRELDVYERGPLGRGRPDFVRVRRRVQPLDAAGRVAVEAWLYLYDRPVAPSRRILDGDYVADRR